MQGHGPIEHLFERLPFMMLPKVIGDFIEVFSLYRTLPNF
jgi:hypothetical protein